MECDYDRYWSGMSDTPPQYDFYNRGLFSLADVRADLIANFSKCPKNLTLTIDGAKYVPIVGFSRMSCASTVYVNPATDDYVFAVGDKCNDDPPRPLLRGSYTSYADTVEEIARYYADFWKLPPDGCKE
jgi:hypothetical protein